MKFRNLSILVLSAAFLLVSCEKKTSDSKKNKVSSEKQVTSVPKENKASVEKKSVDSTAAAKQTSSEKTSGKSPAPVDDNHIARLLSHEDLEILMTADSYETKIIEKSYSKKKGLFSITYKINLASTKKYSKATVYFDVVQEDGGICLAWNSSKNSKVPDWYATAYDKVIRKMSKKQFEYMKDEYPIAYNNFYDVYYTKIEKDK